MNISEFSTSPGTSLSEIDLVRLATFGFEIGSLTPYGAVLIDRVLLRLAELYPTSPKHWTRSELLGWMNDAITELNLIAGYLTQTSSVSWSQTNNVISLPADTIVPLELYYNNEVIKKYTVEGLDSKFNWNDGSVGYKPKAWCPIGTTKILVYPLSQKAAQSLSVVTVYQQDSVVEAGVELEVMPQYIEAIEHYMFARARFKEGGAEFQQADIDYGRFSEMASELKLRCGRQRRVGWNARIKTKTSYIRLKDEK
jgi:hypothetical protein